MEGLKRGERDRRREGGQEGGESQGKLFLFFFNYSSTKEEPGN